MTVTGYKEINNALKALPKAMSDKVWSDINYLQSKIVVNRLKLNAPEGPTGNLVDSMGAIRLRRERLGTVWAGPLRRGGKKGFAGHLVEYGTRARRNRNGANRGRMKKNPFAARSFRESAPALEKALGVSAQKVLTRTIRRYVK